MKVFSSLLLAIFPNVGHPVGHPVQVPVHIQGIGAGTGYRYTVTDGLTSVKAKCTMFQYLVYVPVCTG